MLQSALYKHQAPLIYLVAATISLPAGMLVAKSEEGVSMSLLALAGLAGFVLLVGLPANVYFLGWFLLAPFFQSSADDSALGRGLTWALYIAPALLMVLLTVMRRNRSVSLTRIDFLPAAYLAYVLTSIALTTDLLRANPLGSAKAIVLVVAIGVIAYYYLTIGPGSEISSRTLIVALLVSGAVQGLLAVVDGTIGWNVWHDAGWKDAVGGSRAVGTLANPGILGMFLGCAMMAAIAVLTWGGPRSLRRLSGVVLLVGIPGVLLTLTRGPILATAAVAVLLLILGRARILGFSILVAAAIVFVLLLPSFKQTDLYEQRVTEKANVQFRIVVRDWSIRLAAQKPVFGWGFGSFDRVKNTSGFDPEGVPIRGVLDHTSHDTYLTILVELGVLGLLLFALPFVVVGLKGAARARAPSDGWIVATCLGSLLVIFLTASTIDFRFFSIAQMLPFFFLAILRRVTTSAPARV